MELTGTETAFLAVMAYGGNAAGAPVWFDREAARQNPWLGLLDLGQRVNDFRQDPYRASAAIREGLLAQGLNGHTEAIDSTATDGPYLDSYLGLILKLDHCAFPPTKPGEYMESLPSYLPDGFVDRTNDPMPLPCLRLWEQTVVDKAQIFNRFKPLLTTILSMDFRGLTAAEKNLRIVERIAENVYFSIPRDDQLLSGAKTLSGTVRLGELTEGVCRHQAPVFQVLCQAVGIPSRLVMSTRDGALHENNMVMIGDRWAILDVSNPDYIKKETGNEWRLGIYYVAGEPPEKGDIACYDVRSQYSQTRSRYVIHTHNYWHIGAPEPNVSPAQQYESVA